MKIKTLEELKNEIEKNCEGIEVEIASPTELNIYEDYHNNVDGDGRTIYRLKYEGTVKSAIEAIKNDYEGYNIFGDQDYYGGVVNYLERL